LECKRNFTFAKYVVLPSPLLAPTPLMASLQPIGGIDCGPSHQPQLAQPLPTKKEMNLPKGIPSNAKKVLDKEEVKVG
jgi:hypothetical protein